MGSVRFYVHHDRVEAIPKISGKRIHIRPCVKSRPLKGKKRTEINEKLKFQRPFLIYRNLQANLTEDERAYGSYTYAPSHAVLRNIKSQENISQRYSDNWIIKVNLHSIRFSYVFVRFFTFFCFSLTKYALFHPHFYVSISALTRQSHTGQKFSEKNFL